VIDYTAQDFTRDIQRYDVVLDAVGKSSFLRCRRLLKPRGVYLSSEFGPLAQNLLLALVAPLLGGRKVLLNIARDDPQMASYLRDVLESGAFRPLVDRRYRLEEIVEAYRYVETGRKIGNVVISIEPSAS
jgi:NADPH:quinone reductase-like Zn-dependent oxidoreductase